MAHVARSCSKIPQLDGPIPDPYDDVLSTPNVSMVLQFERHSMQTNTLLLLFFFPLPCIWICVYLACIPTSSGPSILPFDFSYWYPSLLFGIMSKTLCLRNLHWVACRGWSCDLTEDLSVLSILRNPSFIFCFFKSGSISWSVMWALYLNVGGWVITCSFLCGSCICMFHH